MSADKIKSFETEAFKKRLSGLVESGAIDDAVFADVIYTAMSKFGVDEGMFRDSFGLSRGAVDRWTQAQNLPQPAVRPKIIAWIKESLSDY
jgi:hypothetical protein